jgi:hypothetical protein
VIPGAGHVSNLEEPEPAGIPKACACYFTKGAPCRSRARRSRWTTNRSGRHSPARCRVACRKPERRGLYRRRGHADLPACYCSSRTSTNQYAVGDRCSYPAPAMYEFPDASPGARGL